MKKGRDVERRERMRDVSHSGECLCMLLQEACEKKRHTHTQYIGKWPILTLSPKSTTYNQCAHPLSHTNTHSHQGSSHTTLLTVFVSNIRLKGDLTHYSTDRQLV